MTLSVRLTSFISKNLNSASKTPTTHMHFSRVMSSQIDYNNIHKIRQKVIVVMIEVPYHDEAVWEDFVTFECIRTVAKICMKFWSHVTCSF